MDGRIALAPGTDLKLTTATGYTVYSIKQEVGRGGSCIVYDASYTDNLNNRKLVRIKECYPHSLRVSRENDGTLKPEEHDLEAFALAKRKMIAAYQKNHDLFYSKNLTNSIINSSDIYETNGTVYIVSVYMEGRAFSDFQGETLYDCVKLILSAAKALMKIHTAGYLYLDLKPDNVLTIDGSLDMVQLFDFDSVISMEELNAAIQTNDPSKIRASYTKGYASLEQQTGRLRQIGRHSDIYSLGAVLFYALWHKTPSAFDCDPSADYDFSRMIYGEKAYQDSLYPALTAFFHKTLASYYADRYRGVDEAIGQLEMILLLSDEVKPWLHSSPVPRNTVFYGREDEILSFRDTLLKNEHHTVSLYGMGGIGKSSFVRQYLAEYRADWDAAVWLYDQGDITEAIADDTQVHINTVHRFKDETAEEYLKRKLHVIEELTDKQSILLVIDQFDSEHIEQIRALQHIGWTILLISRQRLPEGMFPSVKLDELHTDELVSLFSYYSHRDLNDECDRHCVETIIATVAGHTLLTELLARQVAMSYLDLQATEAAVTGIGLSDLPAEQIEYVHDRSASRGPLLKMLDQLVDIDRFTEQDRICMKLLSLFDMPGIEAGLFKTLTEQDTLDFVNLLEMSGWVKAENRHFYLHPMTREYIRTWLWTPDMKAAADRMMKNLYEKIRPTGRRHDGNRQYPRNYGDFYRVIRIIPRMIDHLGYVSEASQRLLYRWLMDAPVDQDTAVLSRILALIKDPCYLDDDSILRLYETAAYYQARLYKPDDAIELLREMRLYLRKHPSAYYLSAYHGAMAVILSNADGDLKTILHHEERAIAAARLSAHPEAGKQLSACLMNKARTLMSEEMDQKQVRRLILEAEPIVSRYTEPWDYERYQFYCNAAMYYAMDGDPDSARSALDAADAIAFAASDSDLAVAEHLIEEAAPIRMAMNRFDLAEEAVIRAVAMCEKHPEALRYRETIFDAYYFLGRIYAMNEEYIRAEEAFEEAEKRIQDCPYEMELPLCPENVRAEAERIRLEMQADAENNRTE